MRRFLKEIIFGEPRPPESRKKITPPKKEVWRFELLPRIEIDEALLALELDPSVDELQEMADPTKRELRRVALKNLMSEVSRRNGVERSVTEYDGRGNYTKEHTSAAITQMGLYSALGNFDRYNPMGATMLSYAVVSFCKTFDGSRRIKPSSVLDRLFEKLNLVLDTVENTKTPTRTLGR